MMDHQTKIRNLLKQGLIVPVAGAGVSHATAGIPGWKGLIDIGIDYARGMKADAVLIEEAQKLSDADQLTKAAVLVKRLLSAPDHPYPNWLNSVFERPGIKNEKLIESIQNLCQPFIATTNYDDLLSTIGFSRTDMVLDWTQHEQIQSYAYKRKPFILHLHGIYTRPKTLIFGDDDYENLKLAKGYKTVLNNLWMNRHFLFIGCSRDGVMDEDFLTVLKLMQEWFPSDPREHYILLPDKMLGTAQHHELIRACNVHLVPFGELYDDLPRFINSLNPNIEEVIKKHQHRSKRVHESIVSILEAQPHGDFPDTVKSFIQSNLGIKHHWVGDERLQMFARALEEYNKGQMSKQKQLANTQVAIRTEISIEKLEEKISVWTNSGNSTSSMINLDFINTAIIAFEMLKSFPKGMLEDIHKRSYGLIHARYIDGTLESFYREAVTWKKESKDPRVLEGDAYFFENLKRIMQTLLGVLTLNSEEIYGVKSEAKIVKKLPTQYLVMVQPRLLSIRDANFPYDMYAALPWDKNLEFIDAFMISNQEKRIIVGYNEDHCFRWNPQEELIAANFFSAPDKDRIVNVIVNDRDKHVVLEIFTTQSRYVIVNFEDTKDYKLASQGFQNYVRIPQLNTLLCRTSIYLGTKGNCIFEVNTLGEHTAKLTLEDVWRQLLSIPEVAADYQSYQAKANVQSGEEDYRRPDIHDVNLKVANWLGEDILIIRVRFSLNGHADSTALLFVNPRTSFADVKLKVLFPYKNCFSFDLISANDQVDLLVGYLDFGKVGNLIQYFERINEHEIIIAGDQPSIVAQDRLTSFQIRDMLNTRIVTPERAFVNEEGKILHDITLPQLEDKTLEFDEKIHSVYYYHDLKN